MNPNDYEKQKERALSRKYELVALKGGKCEICGYDKNYAAFDFHHVNPNEKEFQLDSRHLSNTSVTKLMTEVDKCMLLCANCHREIHHEYSDKEIVLGKIDDIKNRHVSMSVENKKKQSICKYCESKYDYVNGKIYCSSDCREKDKKYPSFDEITDKYDEVKNWNEVASFFNITRKITQNIRKNNNK